MSKFRIVPHGRLQEWVAEEHGYFADEGLDYEFVASNRPNETLNPSVDSAEGAPTEIKRGAFESMESGRACEISSACHWAVGMAASATHGPDVGATPTPSTPSGIWVAPESPLQTPEDLAGVEVAVGFHSGSHFSALQALESILPRDRISMQFVGGPLDRLQLALDRRVPAANVFGAPGYVLEQQGFRKLVDTSFMIGFLINGDATDDQLRAYFNALSARPARDRRRQGALPALLPRGTASALPPALRPPPGRHRRAPGIRALHPGDVRPHPPLDARLANLLRKPNRQRNLRRGGGGLIANSDLPYRGGDANVAPPVRISRPLSRCRPWLALRQSPPRAEQGLGCERPSIPGRKFNESLDGFFCPTDGFKGLRSGESGPRVVIRVMPLGL